PRPPCPAPAYTAGQQNGPRRGWHPDTAPHDSVQSSSGIMTVTTGSPASPGPQTALRTGAPNPTSAPLPARPPAPRSTNSRAHSPPFSSWQATPRGTATHSAQTAAVTATGTRKPARLGSQFAGAVGRGPRPTAAGTKRETPPGSLR